MQYLRARYYKPETANFLTEDSYLGDILKPLTLNRYNYCAGNPVNYKDPSGNVILESLLIGIGVGAVVGAVGGVVSEIYKGVKEYANQDPANKKDLSTFLKDYDYVGAGLNVAYSTISGMVTVGAITATGGNVAAGCAIGGAVHGALTSATDAIRGTGEAKDKKIETFWDGAKYVAEKTIESAALGAIGGTVFQYTLGAMQPIVLTEAAKYAVSGAASGWATAQTDAVIHNRSLDTSDAIFSAVLGGSMAYAGYKTAEAVTRNNARTVVEETNAKIKATEDPVKENSGNTSSKNSNQNKGGSKNSGKNNANTENNANGRQTSLEENANAAKTAENADKCPNAGKNNSGKVNGVKAREQYMGRTPSKNSKTGRLTIERMRAEGKIRTVRGNTQFQASDGKWYALEEADMAHIKDAVTWWNQTGRFYGPKAPEVREFMLNPKNYYLEHYSINHSQGAKLRINYMSPED